MASYEVQGKNKRFAKDFFLGNIESSLYCLTHFPFFPPLTHIYVCTVIYLEKGEEEEAASSLSSLSCVSPAADNKKFPSGWGGSRISVVSLKVPVFVDIITLRWTNWADSRARLGQSRFSLCRCGFKSNSYG